MRSSLALALSALLALAGAASGCAKGTEITSDDVQFLILDGDAGGPDAASVVAPESLPADTAAAPAPGPTAAANAPEIPPETRSVTPAPDTNAAATEVFASVDAGATSAAQPPPADPPVEVARPEASSADAGGADAAE
jgi:hypothetical protein